MKIWTVDAFTNQPYSGNPAAVMMVENFPSDSICQQIAAEMNLSETAFIKPLAADRFHIRWFTPAVEVKLCGHATLASAHILYQENKVQGNKICFESLSGPLFVYKKENELTLDFPLQAVSAELDCQSFEEILGIKIKAAVKALDDVIIELTDEAAVRAFQPDPEKLRQVDCRGLIITAQAKHHYDFISRFFAPRVGVLEDPVTGSAHCKLADYWWKRLGKTKFFAYQASKRGGELKLEIQGERVYITGQAVTVMQGEWFASVG